MEKTHTNIRVPWSLRDRIAALGNYGDTMPKILERLLDRALYCEGHHDVPPDWREREGKALTRGPALVGAY